MRFPNAAPIGRVVTRWCSADAVIVGSPAGPKRVRRGLPADSREAAHRGFDKSARITRAEDARSEAGADAGGGCDGGGTPPSEAASAWGGGLRVSVRLHDRTFVVPVAARDTIASLAAAARQRYAGMTACVHRCNGSLV